MKKQFDVKVYYEAVVCECGGTFRDYIWSPPRITSSDAPLERKYKCNKCASERMLYESNWPGIKHKIIG